ncbi:MAG: outer membrane protein assembly factor BamB [Thiotrichaceae bacterium]|nr:outer membrane protein assembly factor BamB [Thiotrichaceae bacterium]
MMNFTRICCILLLCTLQGCASWFRGTDNNDPPTPLVEFNSSSTVEKLWSLNVGASNDKLYVKLQPAVDEKRVYAASVKGHLHALKLSTGEKIWERNLELPISAGVSVGEDLVLVGTSTGVLVALAAKDGAEKWRVALSSEILALPRINRGLVLVRTGDGKLWSLDARNGRKLWSVERPVPALSLRGTSAPAAVSDVVVAAFDNGTIAAFQASTGKQGWDIRTATPKGRSEIERMVDIDADPIIFEDSVYIVGFQGKMVAVDIRSGKPRWGKDMSSFAGLAVDNEAVYVSDAQSYVWALDRQTGSSLWKQVKLQYRAVTAPALTEKYLVVADKEGYVHWLNRQTGDFTNRVKIADKLLSPLVVSNNILLVQAENGELSAWQTP